MQILHEITSASFKGRGKGDELVATASTTELQGVKPSLGLTGATVNAMALIAPGAFLWITFQLQAAET